MQRIAAHILKRQLVTPVVLALPPKDGQYSLETDARDTQVGCVLLRERKDETLQPTRYESRQPCDETTRYNTTHKECLAVVWAKLQFWPYQKDTYFVFRTDHASLRWALDL